MGATYSDRDPIRVILVNYNTVHMIQSLLRRAHFGEDDDIIIVDNASQPDEISALCSSTGARPLLLAANRGFAGGVNAALAAGDSRELPTLLLNPDITFDSFVLDSLLQALWKTEADGVAPLLLNSRGRVQVGAAGGNLTLGTVAAYFLFISTLIPSVRGIFYTRSQLRRTSRATWLCMACLLVRPDAFQRFGLLPEDEVVYGEDIAWGTDATARSARFHLVPEIAVIHEQGGSGAGDAWIGAAVRLFHRRLGPVSGRLAVVSMHIGLWVRRILRRGIGLPT